MGPPACTPGWIEKNVFRLTDCMRADCKRPLRLVATYRSLISLKVAIILGTAIAPKITVTASTIISSSSEKPCVFFCIFESIIVATLRISVSGISPRASIVGLGWERIKARRSNDRALGFCNHSGYDGHSLRKLHTGLSGHAN